MPNILIVDDDRTTRDILRQALRDAGFSVNLAADARAGLRQLKTKTFHLLLLDVWMPGMNGLDMIAKIPKTPSAPRIIVMTSDRTPATLLRAVREQAYRYIRKPLDPEAVVELVRDSLATTSEALPIEVLSARPTWVELRLPCDRDAAERVQEFLMQLDIDLPEEMRHTIGHAFHELLMNAAEWGGRWDPQKKVRISYVRGAQMLMYRITDPGPGFSFENLKHAATSNPDDDPIAHMQTREEKGLRPGGLGLLMTQKMADELLYNETQNEVIFVKYLNSPAL